VETYIHPAYMVVSGRQGMEFFVGSQALKEYRTNDDIAAPVSRAIWTSAGASQVPSCTWLAEMAQMFVGPLYLVGVFNDTSWITSIFMGSLAGSRTV
jgi:hypothetical protein